MNFISCRICGKHLHVISGRQLLTDGLPVKLRAVSPQRVQIFFPTVEPKPHAVTAAILATRHEVVDEYRRLDEQIAERYRFRCAAHAVTWSTCTYPAMAQ